MYAPHRFCYLRTYDHFHRLLILCFCFFFFSSRRRHTIFDCDWSSDVCSSDLVPADLKEPAEIKRLMAEVERVAGRLDILVSNAASGVLKDGLELSAKQWDWVLSTNARPLLLLAQEAAPLMPAGGRIVALSSLGSQRVIPGYVAIGVSKAALEALTRYLAVELGRQGITVNAVSAGAVETDVWHMIPDGAQALEAIRARTPGGRLVTPEAVADVVFFLASPAAQGIQGQVLTGDGW